MVVDSSQSVFFSILQFRIYGFHWECECQFVNAWKWKLMVFVSSSSSTSILAYSTSHANKLWSSKNGNELFSFGFDLEVFFFYFVLFYSYSCRELFSSFLSFVPVVFNPEMKFMRFFFSTFQINLDRLYRRKHQK